VSGQDALAISGAREGESGEQHGRLQSPHSSHARGRRFETRRAHCKRQSLK
jgi:hypothetical protein